MAMATFEDATAFRVVSHAGGGVEKSILYKGPMTVVTMDPHDSVGSTKDSRAASLEEDDAIPDDMKLLYLQCGDILSYPVLGQCVGRYERGLFMCPAGIDSEDDIGKEGGVASTFSSYGFQVLEEYADMFESLIRASSDYSDRRKCYAAKKVGQASKKLAKGINTGAHLLGDGIGKASGFLKAGLKKSNKDKKYDNTKAGVGAVKMVTGASVTVINSVSSQVVSTSISISSKLGQKINHSDYVRHLKSKRREKRLRNRLKKPSVVDELVRGTTQVVIASGEGVVDVFSSLEDASEVILDESIEAVSSVVGHSLGKEAGNIAADALGIANDGVKVYKSIGQGGKKFGKNVAKKAIVQGGINISSELIGDKN